MKRILLLATISSVLLAVLATLILQTNSEDSKQSEDTSDAYFASITMCSNAGSLKFEDLPPAKILSDIGNSSWKISTTNDSAQIYFNQGINALHSFWDVEAFKAFKKGLIFDPECAMLHWGLSKSISQTAGELRELKKTAMAKAVELSNNVPLNERDFILAYKERTANGLEAYKSSMEAYIKKYPKQLDAKLFYASALSSGVRSHSPDGVPTPGNIRGQEILNSILEPSPNSSAANHYFIHALENGPSPEKALACAKRISKLAPSSGHLTHMPGHIYYRIGDYDLAIKTFHNSLRVDSFYMASYKMGPINNWNFTHNLDYLVASCAENGQYKEGLKWASKLSSISIDRSRSMTGGSGYILFGAYTAIPRFHIRFEEWNKAYKSIDSLITKIPWNKSKAISYFKGIRNYAEGMHNLQLGLIDEASKNLDQLKLVQEDLKLNRPDLGADWYYRYAVKILAVNSKELEALIEYEKGNTVKAIEQLIAAGVDEKNIGYWEPPHYTRPVYESLAQIYTKEGQLEKVKEAYQYTLKLRPNNGHSQFGLAKAMETLNDDPNNVKKAYKQFLDFWHNADDFDDKVTYAKNYLK